MYGQIVRLRTGTPIGTLLAARDAFVTAFDDGTQGFRGTRLHHLGGEDFVDTWWWDDQAAAEAAFARTATLPEALAWNALVEIVSFEAGTVLADHPPR
jgi:hypothetical protein